MVGSHEDFHDAAIADGGDSAHAALGAEVVSLWGYAGRGPAGPQGAANAPPEARPGVAAVAGAREALWRHPR